MRTQNSTLNRSQNPNKNPNRNPNRNHGGNHDVAKRADSRPSFTRKPSFSERPTIKNPVVYIGNLSYKRDDFGIMKLFKPFGYVEKVNLITDEKTGNSKGIAFVEMKHKKAAAEAVAALNGRIIDGRTAKVSIALERESIEVNKSPRPADRSKNEEKAVIKKSKVRREGLDLLFKNTKNL